jgi:hypothetical protein
LLLCAHRVSRLEGSLRAADARVAASCAEQRNLVSAARRQDSELDARLGAAAGNELDLARLEVPPNAARAQLKRAASICAPKPFGNFTKSLGRETIQSLVFRRGCNPRQKEY